MIQSPDITKIPSERPRVFIAYKRGDRRIEALLGVRELPPPPDVAHFTVRSHGCGPLFPARKPRKPTLASALKQAAKAGKSVRGAEVYPDRVVLQFGEPEPIGSTDPWPLDEFRPKETKQ